MEERLVFDVKDIVVRIVCQKCGTTCGVPPARSALNMGGCPNCREAWPTGALHDLVQVLKELAQDQQQAAGAGSTVQFEVPLGARGHRTPEPLVPGSIASSRP